MGHSDAGPIHIAEPADVVQRLGRTWRRFVVLLRDPEYRVLIGITLLAILLRLIYLDLIPFDDPQVEQLSSALPLAQSFRLPLTGTLSSMGVANPGWASYLFAVPLILGRDPRLAAAFAALLHIGALLAAYACVRRYYGRRAALITALLLAVNPWATLHARELVATSLLLPGAVALFWGLCSAILARHAWGWPVALAGLALMLGVSLTAILLIPGLAILLVLYRRRVRWSYLLLGLCLLLLVLSPYLYYLNETRAADLHVLTAQLRDGRSAERPVRFLTWAADLHSSAHLAELAGQAAAEYRPAPALLRTLLDGLGQVGFWLALLGIAILAMVCWARWRHAQHLEGYVVLLVWLWTPTLLLLALNPDWSSRSVLSILYPAGFIAMGVVLDRVLALPEGWGQRHWWAPLAQAPVWLLLGAVCGWQAYTTLYLNVFLQRHNSTVGYGTPYRYYRRTAAMVLREATDAGAEQVWILEDPRDPQQPALYPQIDYLLGQGLTVVPVGDPQTPALLLPAERTGLYLSSGAAPPVTSALRRLGSVERGLVSHANTIGASVDVTGARSVSELLNGIGQPGLWELQGGPLLLGYDWPNTARAGSTVQLATYWSFGAIAPAQRNLGHDLIVQLVGADGAAHTTTHPFGLAAHFWQPGQVLVVWSDVVPPDAGSYAVGVAMLASDGSNNGWIDANREVQGYFAPLGWVQAQP